MSDHYKEAERLLGMAWTDREWVEDSEHHTHRVPTLLAAAQVHATLAMVNAIDEMGGGR